MFFDTSHKRLRRRIHALPRELFDLIKEFTLAYDPPSLPRVIDVNYKPTMQLQINHALRQSFPSIYYGTPAVWTFRSVKPGEAAVLLEWWMISLSQEAKYRLATAGGPTRPTIPDHFLILSENSIRALLLHRLLRDELVKCWLQVPSIQAARYSRELDVVTFEFRSRMARASEDDRFEEMQRHWARAWKRFKRRARDWFRLSSWMGEG